MSAIENPLSLFEILTNLEKDHSVIAIWNGFNDFLNAGMPYGCALKKLFWLKPERSALILPARVQGAREMIEEKVGEIPLKHVVLCSRIHTYSSMFLLIDGEAKGRAFATGNDGTFSNLNECRAMALCAEFVPCLFGREPAPINFWRSR